MLLSGLRWGAHLGRDGGPQGAVLTTLTGQVAHTGHLPHPQLLHNASGVLVPRLLVWLQQDPLVWMLMQARRKANSASMLVVA